MIGPFHSAEATYVTLPGAQCHNGTTVTLNRYYQCILFLLLLTSKQTNIPKPFEANSSSLGGLQLWLIDISIKIIKYQL